MSESPVTEMSKAITCLALEVASAVHVDVVKRWNSVLAYIESIEQDLQDAHDAYRTIEDQLLTHIHKLVNETRQIPAELRAEVARLREEVAELRTQRDDALDALVDAVREARLARES